MNYKSALSRQLRDVAADYLIAGDYITASAALYRAQMIELREREEWTDWPESDPEPLVICIDCGATGACEQGCPSRLDEVAPSGEAA
jgi:hypothetical protein